MSYMTQDEIIERKSNMFDHLLYEFEMYIFTFSRLSNLNPNHEDHALMKNVLIESHAVHLRNLIEFFNCDFGGINMKTIFSEPQDLSFDDTALEAKKTVNRAIEHLTEERYKWSKSEKDLAIRAGMVIPTAYRDYIVPRIKICISLLKRKDGVKQKHLDALQDVDIQRRLTYLEQYLQS